MVFNNAHIINVSVIFLQELACYQRHFKGRQSKKMKIRSVDKHLSVQNSFLGLNNFISKIQRSTWASRMDIFRSGVLPYGRCFSCLCAQCTWPPSAFIEATCHREPGSRGNVTSRHPLLPYSIRNAESVTRSLRLP